MKDRTIGTLLFFTAFFCLFGCGELLYQNESWDYLVFSQQWPQSECLQAQTEHHACQVNKNTTTWTVHGLWPTQYGKETPNYCNNSDHFQPQQISSIEAELRELWPNLFTDEPYYTFWNHEWTKHGTCGKSMPALDSQLKYFSMGLTLNKKFNLSSAFAQKNITPGKTYQMSDIVNAMQGFGPPKMRCSYLQGKEYLAQISLCLTKDFKVLDCDKVGQRFHKQNSLYGVEPCTERGTMTVVYPTIQHN